MNFEENTRAVQSSKQSVESERSDTTQQFPLASKVSLYRTHHPSTLGSGWIFDSCDDQDTTAWLRISQIVKNIVEDTAALAFAFHCTLLGSIPNRARNG